MLHHLDEGVYVADHDFSLLGANIGTRTTVIRLSDGGLWVHSPGPMTGGWADEVDALGEVRFLIAPNAFHHLYLAVAQERWPGAECHGAPGVAEKEKELTFTAELNGDPGPGWAADLEQILIGGAPKVNEIAFFHRATRTLLLVDLVFNMTPSSLWERVFTHINGSVGLGTSRLMRFMLKDQGATRSSVEQIFEWDFDRVIMAHGEVVDHDAKASLRTSFGWLMGA